jgi:hypothetical protein
MHLLTLATYNRLQLEHNEHCPGSKKGLVVGPLHDLEVLSSLQCDFVDQHELVFLVQNNSVSSLITYYDALATTGSTSWRATV